MDNILTEYSQKSLARAIEKNHDDQLLNLGRNIGAEIYDGPELKGILTEHPFPTFNVVSRTRLRPDVADAKIRKILGIVNAHRVPLGWWVWPSTKPHDLGDRLASNGLTYKGVGYGVAVDLNTVDMDYSLPTGLSFETVRDEEALKNFFLPFNVVHKLPDFVSQALFKGFRRMGFESEQPYRHFIGWMDGKPVASISLFVSAGVTGVYNVVTIPECRRKGVGAALLSHILKKAHATGYRFNVGIMSAMMQSVALRNGYKEICNVSYYEWMPKKKKKSGLKRLANYIHRALT